MVEVIIDAETGDITERTLTKKELDARDKAHAEMVAELEAQEAAFIAQLKALLSNA